MMYGSLGSWSRAHCKCAATGWHLRQANARTWLWQTVLAIDDTQKVDVAQAKLDRNM
jgi:hypothetical protein